ncbi:MAG TPA: diguanylate cyclase [Clostridiaceae bacterium]
MKNKNFTILIVDDNPHNLQVLAEVVQKDEHEVIIAMNGKEALEAISMEKPDLILLDVMMPGLDGYEVCKRIKEKEDFEEVPIIFLTAKTETEDIVKGFESGAIDYIKKPFNPIELGARIKTHLDLKSSRDQLKKAYEIIKLKNDELKEVMEKLEVAAVTDPLTGLNNRRFIIEKIVEEIVRFKRFNQVFSLIITDVDLFKNINDSHGHDYGDYVLNGISYIMKHSLREIDYISRWGGEEFLILLPETEVEGAKIIAERMRKRIFEKEFVFNNISSKVTMTFGVASIDQKGDMYETIKRCDEALYEGKASGRNIVIVANKE